MLLIPGNAICTSSGLHESYELPSLPVLRSKGYLVISRQLQIGVLLELTNLRRMACAFESREDSLCDLIENNVLSMFRLDFF